MNRKKEVCRCNNVTYGMIEDAVKNGAKSLEEVQNVIRVGKGCGDCREFLIYLIESIREELENQA